MPAAHASDQEFLAIGHALVAEAVANKDLFLKHGMWDGAIDDLNQGLAAYDRARAEGNEGRAAHTGARAEIRSLCSELVAMVKQLEGMMVIRFRDDPNLRGAWESARNVPWPAPQPVEKKPAPTVPPKESAA